MGSLHDEGTIYRRADGSYFAFTNTDTFDAYVRGHSPDADVTLSNLLHEMPLVSVQGPTSRQILQSLSDFDFTTLPYFRFAEPVTVAGINVFISRTGFSGELGYELIPARQDAERLWLALARCRRPPRRIQRHRHRTHRGRSHRLRVRVRAGQHDDAV